MDDDQEFDEFALLEDLEENDEDDFSPEDIEEEDSPAAAASEVSDISVYELDELLSSDEKVILIDVREPSEYDICHIEGSVLIPLNDFEGVISEYNKSEKYVVHCKLGGRSARAVAYMKELGFESVKNLEGGIISWAQEIDPDMEIY
tara:strand:- start:77 stop:517 length:441 start_codon:yes stop_codon:yes gene_type:complete